MALKLKPVQSIPFLIAAGSILLVCILHLARFEFLEGLERVSYDIRVRYGYRADSVIATNLGFVFIDETTIRHVRKGVYGYAYSLYWPRAVYARMVQELAEQGASAMAFDVLFGELRKDMPTQVADGSFVDPDWLFAQHVRYASNVILAVTPDLTPPAMFRTNAAALGDISTDKDPDGILRHARAFRTYRKWHPAFEELEADPDWGVDLREARVEPGRVVLPRMGGLEPIEVPLDNEGLFEVADLAKPLPGMAPKAWPYEEPRIWHMGIVLAAGALGLDLEKAEVDLNKGRVVLRNSQGLVRVIPVDHEGKFLIDWRIPPRHPQFTVRPAHELLRQNAARLKGETEALGEPWRNKLVVIGSSALANDLTDRGATPLAKDTLLVSKHWNVANSVLTGTFVRQLPPWGNILISGILIGIAATLTWRFGILVAWCSVGTLAVGYVLATAIIYNTHRLWFPIVLPLAGTVAAQLGILTWRVVFEQAQKRLIKSVFAKMVSPKIVQELLSTEHLALGGSKVEVTVFFADIRGFTELTVTTQQRVAEYVRAKNLSPIEAEACFEEEARETLNTVNTYLAVIADVIKKNDGTLDKFIGDCVMAYWGAPTPNRQHAAACVKAAIEAQRAVAGLNNARAAENQKRSSENLLRTASGQQPLTLLPLLDLGTGINTGSAMAGLMGSAKAESLSYTVFGREVNLASRLEGASGHGRIFIGETTYQHLLRDEPSLAASCAAREPVRLKGFTTSVQVYEVSWRVPEVIKPADLKGVPERIPESVRSPAL